MAAWHPGDAEVIIVDIDPETERLVRPKEDGPCGKTAIAIPHLKDTEPTEMMALSIEGITTERVEQDSCCRSD